MINMRVAVMASNGKLAPITIPVEEWVNALQFKPNNTVVYPGTKPSNLDWDFYYVLSEELGEIGGNIDLLSEMDMNDLMAKLLQVPRGKKFVPDESMEGDDFYLENNLHVDVQPSEYVTQAATHGWVGVKMCPVDGGGYSPVAPVLIRCLSAEAFVVCNVEESTVRECDKAQLILELSKLGDDLEIVGQPKAPSMTVKLTPIFEALGEVKLSTVLLATGKDEKLGKLRQTVANLGLQPRGKTAGDLSEAIQETLHEIADKHHVGDVLIAHESSEPLGSLVKVSSDFNDAYTQNEQISILARESGGVVMPSTPLLSRVKDMVLLKPIL